MRRYTRSSKIISVVVLLACAGLAYASINHYIKRGPIKNPDALRARIFASIKNPFPQANGFVLETRWAICGNSTPDELPLTFNTLLDSSVYKTRLSNKMLMPVLGIDEFNSMAETITNNKHISKYSSPLRDSCKMGKVMAYILSKQITRAQLKLYESYIYNDTVKLVTKDFVFKNNVWLCNVIDTAMRIIAKNP